MLQELGLRQVYVDFNTESIGTLYAKEGEVNSRGLLIQLVHKGKIVQDDDFIVNFFGSTQDGLVYHRKADKIENKPGLYQLIYPANMLKAGQVNAEIRLFKNDDNISTKTFQIFVDNKVVSDDLIEGIDEPDLLTKLLGAAVNEQIRIDNEEIRVQNEIGRIEYIEELKQGLAGDAELSSVGKLLISEAIEEKGIQSNKEDTFEEMSNQIREIHTPILKGVVDMSNSFAGTQADLVDLRFVDTSRLWNANRMFLNANIGVLDISMNNLGDLTDVQYMFSGANIGEIRAKYQDTNLVTDCSYMFSNSNIGGSVKIADIIDTRNVTNMNGMFYGSQSTTLDLSSFNTSKVTNMSKMFESSRATTLDLSSFDTSRVTDMQSMFRDCQATTLDLSSFDTSMVTNMSYMFYGCSATTLDLSSFNTSKVAISRMAGMFQRCAATTGYARTQAEADEFNAVSGKPAHLVFIVKPEGVE